jgi:hypothetical protein
VRAVVEALAGETGPRAARSRAVAGETWDHKVDEIERHLAALVEEERR